VEKPFPDVNKPVYDMPAAGYPGTPLLKKLGIKADWKIRLIGAPADYFDWLEADLSGQVCGAREVPDFIHLFASSLKEFEKGIGVALALAAKNPQLVVWVSWYKRSSGKATDVTENIIRDHALANGLVDVKVCAVSEEWSGLKLVVPMAKR